MSVTCLGCVNERARSIHRVFKRKDTPADDERIQEERKKQTHDS